uniref:Transposase n=1 Tax=Myoviridae sp. ctbwh6 TaxID=2827611 RepID=A0A8S5LHW2_9CAUD|nr:MAG TPA: hypothetical protein [Myoviridae sp. ctbwh6]
MTRNYQYGKLRSVKSDVSHRKKAVLTLRRMARLAENFFAASGKTD